MNEYDLIEKRIHEAEDLEAMAKVLSSLLSGGYSVWTDGSLYSIRQLVAVHKGLKIEIRPKEHSPPHFHVKCGGLSASFSIESCELLQGDIDRRNISLIEWWHQRSKDKLVKIWNETRPSDCPAGPIIA